MSDMENEVVENGGEELSDVIRIRREKLDALRAAGLDNCHHAHRPNTWQRPLNQQAGSFNN